jgi:hypothetical protein
VVGANSLQSLDPVVSRVSVLLLTPRPGERDGVACVPAKVQWGRQEGKEGSCCVCALCDPNILWMQKHKKSKKRAANVMLVDDDAVAPSRAVEQKVEEALPPVEEKAPTVGAIIDIDGVLIQGEGKGYHRCCAFLMCCASPRQEPCVGCAGGHPAIGGGQDPVCVCHKWRRRAPPDQSPADWSHFGDGRRVVG